jgi:hypothetical protein
MPPLRERLVEPRPKTQEEEIYEAKIDGKKRQLYEIMQELAPVAPKLSRFGRSYKVAKTVAAEYLLPGRPSTVKMTAWVERVAANGISEHWNNRVFLKTQVVEEVRGVVIAKEDESERATARDGELHVDGLLSLPYEQQLEALANVEDTLELIARTERGEI